MKGSEILAFNTFFVVEVAEVGEQLGIGLHTKRFSDLQASPTQARLVATPTVLLAEQRVHPAIAPLRGPPTVTVSKARASRRLREGERAKEREKKRQRERDRKKVGTKGRERKQRR